MIYEARIKALEEEVAKYKRYWCHPQSVFDENKELKAELERLVSCLRIASGLASTLKQNEKKHPMEVYEEIEAVQRDLHEREVE